MGKGSPIVQVRIPALWLSAMDAAIEKNIKGGKSETPKTRSRFLLKALAEKLGHLNRGRKLRSTIPTIDGPSELAELVSE